MVAAEEKIVPQTENVEENKSDQSKITLNEEVATYDKEDKATTETKNKENDDNEQNLRKEQPEDTKEEKEKIISKDEEENENTEDLVGENGENEENKTIGTEEIEENRTTENDGDDDENKENEEDEDDDWEDKEHLSDSELKKGEASKSDKKNNVIVYTTEFLQDFRDKFKDTPSELKDLKEIFKSTETNSPYPTRNLGKSTGSTRRKGGFGGGRKDKPPRKKQPPPQRKVPIVSQEESTVRKATSILNKIAPENSFKLTKQLQELHLTIDQLKTITKKIFDKALTERKYCTMYAQLCNDLYRSDNSNDKDGNASYKKEFRTILLTSCQQEFEKRKTHTYSDDPQIRMQEDSAFRARMRGNMEFVGQLSLLNLLSPKIVRLCFKSLLDDPDSINIEAFCKLMATVGRQYDQPKYNLDQFFEKLKEIRQTDNDLDSRIRFMILDIIELRENGWVERRKQNVATTINKVHETYEKEKSQVSLGNPRGSSSSVTKSSTSRPKPFKSSTKSQAPPSIKNSDDGWQTVATSSSKLKPSGSKSNVSSHATSSNKSVEPSKNKFSNLSQDSFSSSQKQQQQSTNAEAPLITDKDKRKNLTFTSLEEFYNSGDVEEACLSIKEDVLDIKEGSIHEKGVEVKIQIEIVIFIFEYLFEHIKASPDLLIPVLISLLKSEVITTLALKDGIKQIIGKLDDITELVPNAPARVGFIVGKLFDQLDKNIRFLKACLSTTDETNQSKLVCEIYSVLETDLVHITFFFFCGHFLTFYVFFL